MVNQMSNSQKVGKSVTCIKQTPIINLQQQHMQSKLRPHQQGKVQVDFHCFSILSSESLIDTWSMNTDHEAIIVTSFFNIFHSFRVTSHTKLIKTTFLFAQDIFVLAIMTCNLVTVKLEVEHANC